MGSEIGERPDAEVMAKRSIIQRPVPDRVAYLTAGIDSQLAPRPNARMGMGAR
ncbi:hypothetical protein ACLB1E_22080 [Escherichia coli]